jgi:4-hydroxy-3-methylbut-2-enyl diphosphate reductase IspH
MANKSIDELELQTNAMVEKAMASTSLAEVVDRILDKGIVIDAWARVSLVGIEILSVEARIVIASVETYLKYAEAVGLTAPAAAPEALAPAPTVK